MYANIIFFFFLIEKTEERKSFGKGKENRIYKYVKNIYIWHKNTNINTITI